jgi:tetratricopeptide (TPR) repeat protein
VIASVAAFGQARNSHRSITVVTEPNSTIWIDGVRYGVTDDRGRLAMASIPPGVRSLRVRADGYSQIVKSLPAATAGEVSVKLTKSTDEAELAYQAAETATTVDRQKAIAEYERAIKLRPKYPEAYLGLARMYSETGDLEKADKAVRTAKKLKPGYAEASAVEGRILKDSGEEDKAIVAFKRAIVEGKGFQPEAYTGLGLLYKDRAESFGGSAEYEQEAASYNESAKYLAVAVKQLGSAPDAIIVYQLLGLIYERQKKFKEAIALYEEFLKIFPDASEAGAVQSFIIQIKKQMAEQK